ALSRADLDRFVLRVDLLRGQHDRLHDELRCTAAGDAVQRRTDSATLAVHGMAARALSLALLIEEELPARFRIAGHVGLPGIVDRDTGQATDIADQFGDLLLLEGFAELFHGRTRH